MPFFIIFSFEKWLNFCFEKLKYFKFYQKFIFQMKKSRKALLVGELLPFIELGVSWEVSALASQICLPSSSGSPCPDNNIIAYIFYNFKFFLQFLYIPIIKG